MPQATKMLPEWWGIITTRCVTTWWQTLHVDSKSYVLESVVLFIWLKNHETLIYDHPNTNWNWIISKQIISLIKFAWIRSIRSLVIWDCSSFLRIQNTSVRWSFKWVVPLVTHFSASFVNCWLETCWILFYQLSQAQFMIKILLKNTFNKRHKKVCSHRVAYWVLKTRKTPPKIMTDCLNSS